MKEFTCIQCENSGSRAYTLLLPLHCFLFSWILINKMCVPMLYYMYVKY